MKTFYYAEVVMTAERKNPVRRIDFGIASDKEDMVLRCPEAHVREYAQKLRILGVIRVQLSVKKETDNVPSSDYYTSRTYELLSRMDAEGNIYVREMTDEDRKERI